MKKRTCWVTFEDPRIHATPIVRVRFADPHEPRTYQIIIDSEDNSSDGFILSTAIALAKPLHQAWLEQQYAEPGDPSQTSKQDELADPDANTWFSVSEIMPYVDAMMPRLVTVAKTGIRLELTESGTASTDCEHVVRLNPEPFRRGKIEAGNGRVLHEAGHILYDRYETRKNQSRKLGQPAIGIQLLATAGKDKDPLLVDILNFVMDRRSDDLQVNDFPGHRLELYRRLGDLMPGERVLSDDTIIRKPNGTSLACKTSVLEDFSYAIKKRTRPHHAIVCRCVNLALRAIRRVNAGRRSYDHLLTVSRIILTLLRKHLTREEQDAEKSRQEAENAFKQFIRQLNKAIYGTGIDATIRRDFEQQMKLRLDKRRRLSLAQLPAIVQRVPAKGPVSPSQTSGGIGGSSGTFRTISVPKDTTGRYDEVSSRVRRSTLQLRSILEQLTVPQIYVMRGLPRGDFDLDAIAMLMAGSPEVMQREYRDPKLDLGLAVLVDVSGSMKELQTSTDLGVAFNNAMIGHESHVDARLFAFNNVLYDCGPPQRQNGIASLTCEHGTLEAEALEAVGKWILTNRRRRRFVITICDGAPADVEATKLVADRLFAQGVLPIRILVGVHAAPHTYPFELFFNSWDELFREIETFFSTLVSSARSA